MKLLSFFLIAPQVVIKLLIDFDMIHHFPKKLIPSKDAIVL